MNRRPLLLMVYTDSLFAASCSRYFRRRGWSVRMASPTDDLGNTVDALEPTAVVIDAATQGGDFAQRACNHIKQHKPGLTLVLSTADQFAGDDNGPAQDAAAIVRRSEGVEGLAERILNVPQKV